MASLRSRALAATAVLALATTAACSGGDSDKAANDNQIALAVFASLNGLPAFSADEAGTYDDHDLDVTVSSVKTATEMVPQITGGKIDIALMDTASSLVAAAQGVDLVYIAGGTSGGIPAGQEKFSFANVWVANDSDIDSLDDLDGKTVAIPQIKSQPWVDLRGSVDAAGGDSSTIKFIESPDPVTALKSGQVDAITTSEPLGTIEKGKGEITPIGPVNSGGGGLAYVYVTTKKWADANPEIVARFVDATIEANTAVNADKASGVTVAADVLGLPADALEVASFPVYSEAKITADDISFAIDYMDRYDMFEKGAPEASDLLFQP